MHKLTWTVRQVDTDKNSDAVAFVERQQTWKSVYVAESLDA